MTLKVHTWLKSLRSGIYTILFLILIAFILRILFIEIYQIQSTSMEPALLPGDIIMVSKMSYGARVLKPVKFIKEKKIEYIRTKGWSSVKKGDVIVFNWPRYSELSDSDKRIYGDYVVKRCSGLPGDVVQINNEVFIELKDRNYFRKSLRDLQPGRTLFPHDSTLNWTLVNYGPLYVPKKGDLLRLTKRNVYWYRDILLYENSNSQIIDSTLMVNDEKLIEYTFKNNYYFMLGDNFFNSIDSRYWGFVPEGNIVGKSMLVLLSIDQYYNGIKKIRWNRFFKLLKIKVE